MQVATFEVMLHESKALHVGRYTKKKNWASKYFPLSQRPGSLSGCLLLSEVLSLGSVRAINTSCDYVRPCTLEQSVVTPPSSLRWWELTLLYQEFSFSND